MNGSGHLQRILLLAPELACGGLWDLLGMHANMDLRVLPPGCRSTAESLQVGISESHHLRIPTQHRHSRG
jgi:hypothetical protein